MIDARLLTALGLTTCALAACGGSVSTSSAPASSEGPTSTASASPIETPTPGPTTIATGSTSLGTVLTTPAGLTLYYFTPEKGGTVACTGGCATTWPPLKASGAESKPSVATGTLGSVALSDGSMQVTYNGWPLHTYAGDSAAGQTNGQGIAGKWYAATPSLSSSGAAAAAAATPTGNPYGY